MPRLPWYFTFPLSPAPVFPAHPTTSRRSWHHLHSCLHHLCSTFWFLWLHYCFSHVVSCFSVSLYSRAWTCFVCYSFSFVCYCIAQCLMEYCKSHMGVYWLTIHLLFQVRSFHPFIENTPWLQFPSPCSSQSLPCIPSHPDSLPFYLSLEKSRLLSNNNEI